jgi:hypothetical protein
MAEHMRIESGNRSDTLDLVHRLPHCRWFLVEREALRWDVHVETASAELLSEVLAAVERWACERHVESIVHLRSRDVRLPSPSRPRGVRQARGTPSLASRGATPARQR